jgi:ABC-type transport system involved in multi-copper enzyme maturation permease subunit
MISALFRRHLRQHAVLLSILFLFMLLMEFFLVWVSTQMDMGPEFQALLEAFLPPEITEMVFSQFGVTSFEGAVAFGYQHPLTLVGSIALVIVAATLPAAEREKGYLDLFLARPVPRGRYLSSVCLFLGLAAVALPLGLLLGTALGLGFVESPPDLGWATYLPCALVLSLLLMAIGAYSLLFATGARRRGTAAAQGVAFTLLFYWMDFMGNYWDTLVVARKASPFFYFDPGQAASGSGLSLTQVTVLSSITILAGLLAFYNFQKQDL